MIAFRPMAANDERFVVSSWAMSYRDSDYAGLIAYDDWHRVMRPTIAKLLRRPGMRTVVAHETDDPDPLADLYGFVTADTTADVPVVYYVYVKHAYRLSGIARALFDAIGVDPARPFRYACKTAAVSKIYEARKIPCAQWDPVPARDNQQRRAG